ISPCVKKTCFMPGDNLTYLTQLTHLTLAAASMHWHLLDKRLLFPHPRMADEEGLLAIGGDLSVARLLLAYRSGIFPWTVDPITWWSPDPRAIFELDGL